MSQLLDPTALASEWGIPEATLAQWRYRGIGPSYVKVGRHVRYRRDDLEAFLREQTIRSSGVR